jgi:SAM-dependent methyltransferase
MNERAVEISLAVSELSIAQKNHKRILEIGNVLSHYVPTNHIIVDKYEKEKGVINKDIVDYMPRGKFDLILCISTLEHVGWDEPKKEKVKTKQAAEKVRSLLKPGGKAFFTFPFGYNPHLDKYVRTNTLGLDRMWFMERIGWDNRWGEIPLPKKNVKYNEPYCNANVVVVGEMTGI